MSTYKIIKKKYHNKKIWFFSVLEHYAHNQDFQKVSLFFSKSIFDFSFLDIFLSIFGSAKYFSESRENFKTFMALSCFGSFIIFLKMNLKTPATNLYPTWNRMCISTPTHFGETVRWIIDS